MKVPADAARAPLGDTYTTTGTLAFRMALTMRRVDSTRPAGGVELEHHGASAVGLGLVDALRHVFHDDGIDDALDQVDVDVRVGRRGRRPQEQRQAEEGDGKAEQARHTAPEQ